MVVSRQLLRYTVAAAVVLALAAPAAAQGVTGTMTGTVGNRADVTARASGSPNRKSRTLGSPIFARASIHRYPQCAKIAPPCLAAISNTLGTCSPSRGYRFSATGILARDRFHHVRMTRFDVAPDALQIRSQVGCRLVAQLAVFLEAVVDDFLQTQRHLRIERDGRHRRSADDGRQNRRRRLPGERPMARRAFVEHDARLQRVRGRIRARFAHVHQHDRTGRTGRTRGRWVR